MPTSRVVAAATLAGAHDFIVDPPEGYDTIVGERCSGLFGGQRQRIVVARALITDIFALIAFLDEESDSTPDRAGGMLFLKML
jgi:subfamily B ATP-binding cassette protein HlyB/CyaB